MLNKRGFTLIEFIIVMAIIGILVLMAAPKFMDYIRDAKKTQIANDERIIEDIIKTELAKAWANDEDKVFWDKMGVIDEEIVKRSKTKLKVDDTKVFIYDDETEKVEYFVETTD